MTDPPPLSPVSPPPPAAFIPPVYNPPISRSSSSFLATGDGWQEHNTPILLYSTDTWFPEQNWNKTTDVSTGPIVLIYSLTPPPRLDVCAQHKQYLCWAVPQSCHAHNSSPL